MLAAFLLAQLEERATIQRLRKRLWRRYERELTEWASTFEVRLPFVPAHCRHPHHLFYLLLPSSHARNALLCYLHKKGIQSVFHYIPLHLSTMGKRFGGSIGDCPVAEEMSRRLVRLPLYTGLTEREQQEIICAVRDFDIHK